MTDDVRNLLGGYATGILTEQERTRLYEAALEDPALFEALADEQALRNLLDDSAARAHVLAAIENRRFSILASFRDWLERPKSKVLAGLGGVALVAVVITGVLEHSQETRVVRETPALIATAPAPGPVVEPERTPAAPVARPAQPKVKGKAPAAPPAGIAPQPASESPIQYAVLLRKSAGNFEPVSAGYVFAPGDRVRLRIEAPGRGTLLVTEEDNGRTLFAGTISAGAPVLVPGEVTFDSAEPRNIEVAFTPLPDTVSGPVGGVVGGVPAAVSPEARAKAGAAAAPPATAAAPPATMYRSEDEERVHLTATTPETIRLQIQLRAR
jgi:hypothetical protein